MIWERAVSKVAPELGISDVALRKRCIAHSVPLPGATYWGRLHAGQTPRRTPLPPLPAGVSDQIVINGRVPSDPPSEVAAAIADARAHAPAETNVPSRSRLVTATMKAARAAEPDRDWGAVTRLGPDCFQIRVHPASFDRLEAFLTALAHHVQARGWRLAPGRDGLEMVVDGEAMAFSIAGTIRRARHVATVEEERTLARWDGRHRDDYGAWRNRPVLPWWDVTPTGELRLEIDSWPYVEGVARRFADSRTRKLEGRLDDILVSFAAHAAQRKIESVRALERQRREELARIERARLERLAKLEHARVEWLDRKLAEQRQVIELRSFVERLGTDTLDEAGAAMREWVRLRLAAAEARLAPAALAAEVGGMDAFTALSADDVPTGSHGSSA
jgi:hypothetical protein